MKRYLRPDYRSLLAGLLATLMLVVTSNLAAQISVSHLDSTPQTHCHHHAEMTQADHGDSQHCSEDDACQCLTLCQINATTVALFSGQADIPDRPWHSDLETGLHDGIHHLPLRPPSLTV
ncbi:hypothetical protein [Alcanivorax sp.]|uniref:hypothetical protein n=1 Tax=Alcanivorax sp. TaxID=1872427 RepID=UPI0025C0EFE6|nr:hypothetical protein [Alcanivorax sp.]